MDAYTTRRRWSAAFLCAVLVAAGAACTARSAEQEEPDIEVEEILPAGMPEIDPIPLDPEPVDPQPFDDAEQTASGDGDDPCPGILVDGLVVTPNPMTIISGNRGYIDIRNCAEQAMVWHASTVGWVTLADSDGSLPSGAIFRLLFTVTTSSLPVGPYSFVLKVNNINVQVHGTKLGGLVAPGQIPTPSPVPTVGGLIAPGISPCATSCIQHALLSTLPGRADVSLDVKTNTPADIVVQVDTREPLLSNDGEPYYTDPYVRVATDSRRTQWTTKLSPLEPDTRYHIVVAARDHLGGTSYETGTFRTPNGADQFAAGQPGGCSIACVSYAALNPRPGTPKYDIEVRTLVPTKLRVLANGTGIAGTGAEFVTSWDALLELEPETHYTITLRATDEQGRRVDHVATVTTPKADRVGDILVTFHSAYVDNDADNSGANYRGEITLRFMVNGDRFGGQLDTGERKVHAPQSVSLDDGDHAAGRSVLIEDAPDALPIRVQAQERDLHGGLTSFCAAGEPFFDETSGRSVVGGCMELEWNTAEAVIDLDQDQSGGALPPCYGFGEGVTGDLCIALAATGDDPTFTVYITIDFLG